MVRRARTRPELECGRRSSGSRRSAITRPRRRWRSSSSTPNDTPPADGVARRGDGRRRDRSSGWRPKVVPWGHYLRYEYADVRFQRRSTRPASTSPVRRAEDRRPSRSARRSMPTLAADARRVVPRADGPYVRQRGVPGLARRPAHGRRAPGAAEPPALRRLPDGPDHRHAVRAGRANPRPRRRRLVRRRRLRHPARLTRRDAVLHLVDTWERVPAAARRDPGRPGRRATSTSTAPTASPTSCSRSSTARCSWWRSTGRSAARSRRHHRAAAAPVPPPRRLRRRRPTACPTTRRSSPRVERQGAAARPTTAGRSRRTSPSAPTTLDRRAGRGQPGAARVRRRARRPSAWRPRRRPGATSTRRAASATATGWRGDVPPGRRARARRSQLLIATKEKPYADRFQELVWPALERAPASTIA